MTTLPAGCAAHTWAACRVLPTSVEDGLVECITPSMLIEEVRKKRHTMWHMLKHV